MNHQNIIARKIEFLNGHSQDDISTEMKAVVNDNQELQAELAFIESIWTNLSPTEETKPTSNMDARFYQMLSQAQASQSDSNGTIRNQSQSKGLLERFQSLFTFQPMAQFAMLAMLFLGGWLANDVTAPGSVNSTANLEQQIESLNVMVALSMLQNQSTTERLAGVSYANTSQVNNSKITQVLFEILNQDRSNAVRLAVIDVLSKQAEESMVRSQLLDSLNENQSTMVQASLARLLLNSNTQLSQNELLELLNNKGLDKEVIDYLQQHSQSDV